MLTEAKALADLKEHGLAVVCGPELLGQETCDRLDAWLTAFRDMPQVGELERDFHAGKVRTDVLKPHMVKSDQVGVVPGLLDEVARHPNLAAIVGAYLGDCRLHARFGWYFFPRPYERKRVWSESWHRDPEGPTLLKVFYHPEAVDAESGPMQYIPASRVGGPLESLCPPGVYPTCDIDALVHPSQIVTCEVPARSLVIVNSANLHRGGFTKSKGRLSATWCYLPLHV